MNLDFSIIPKYTGYLLTATGVTIKVTLLALVFGFLLAVPLAFMKINIIIRGIKQSYLPTSTRDKRQACPDLRRCTFHMF